jgi:hypothetical protein
MRKRLLVSFYVDVDIDDNCNITDKELKSEIKDQIERGTRGCWTFGYSWGGYKKIKVTDYNTKIGGQL